MWNLSVLSINECHLILCLTLNNTCTCSVLSESWRDSGQRNTPEDRLAGTHHKAEGSYPLRSPSSTGPGGLSDVLNMFYSSSKIILMTHLRSVLLRARNLSPPTSSITLYFSFSAILQGEYFLFANISSYIKVPCPLFFSLLLVVGDHVLGPGHLLGGGPHPSILLPPCLPFTRPPRCLCHRDDLWFEAHFGIKIEFSFNQSQIVC